MNWNISSWDWISVLCGVLFLYRGVQDLRNGSGTGWSSEDEKKNFSKFSGIALLLCGAVYLVNIFLPRVEPLHSILLVAALVVCIGFLISHLCYTLYRLNRDDRDKKK